MKRTLHSDSKPFVTLPVAVRAADATTNGTAVDRTESKNNFRLAHVLVIVGTLADGTQEFALEVSENNSDWSPANPDFLLGSLPVVDTSNDNAVYEVGYTGSERYLRVSVIVDVPALGNGGPSGAVILMHGARRTPV